MGLETGTYISDLVSTNPTTSDLKNEGDDHIRLIKATVKATFPNFSGAVTPTHTAINYLTSAVSANVTGNVTIAAPSSGYYLTLAGADSTSTLQLLGGNTTGQIDYYSNGSNVTARLETIRSGNNASGLFKIYTASSGSLASRFEIGPAGNVTINAAGSGVTLAVTAVSAQYGITVSSGLGGQAVNWVATSDRRIKSEIADINENDAITAVKFLRAKSYLKEGQRDLGLIAQDVQALGGKFADAVKQAEGQDLLGLNYDGLTVAMLLPVVQNLLRRVEELESRA